MKYLNLILLLLCFNVYGQEWIDDSNFNNKINERSAFGDDQTLPVVVEFWAEFNDGNKFTDWGKLKDELIRNTIMDTQDDVEEIKETIKKIDERLYKLTR